MKKAIEAPFQCLTSGDFERTVLKEAFVYAKIFRIKSSYSAFHLMNAMQNNNELSMELHR